MDSWVTFRLFTVFSYYKQCWIICTKVAFCIFLPAYLWDRTLLSAVGLLHRMVSVHDIIVDSIKCPFTGGVAFLSSNQQFKYACLPTVFWENSFPDLRIIAHLLEEKWYFPNCSLFNSEADHFFLNLWVTWISFLWICSIFCLCFPWVTVFSTFTVELTY